MNYTKGKAEAGQKADVKDWRVARTIFVADDDKTALRYGREDVDYKRIAQFQRADLSESSLTKTSPN